MVLPACPFPVVAPSSETPCPFEECDDGVVIEVNPAPEVPVPFPRSGSSSEQAGLHEDNFYPPPNDPDADGFYEDLNGNRYIDDGDPLLYIGNLEWIGEHQPLSCFDYDGNGVIDYADAILLMNEI